MFSLERFKICLCVYCNAGLEMDESLLHHQPPLHPSNHTCLLSQTFYSLTLLTLPNRSRVLSSQASIVRAPSPELLLLLPYLFLTVHPFSYTFQLVIVIRTIFFPACSQDFDLVLRLKSLPVDRQAHPCTYLLNLFNLFSIQIHPTSEPLHIIPAYLHSAGLAQLGLHQS